MSSTRRQVIVAIFTFAVSGFAAPEKPNFSGRWRLDPSRSSKDAPADLAETIDHREPVVRIDTEWDRSRPAGVSNGALLAPAVQLKSDGTESSNDVPMGLSLATKSHWGGDKFVTEWRLNGLDVPLSGTWTRYLTGPTTMVVDSVTESNGRHLTARYIFSK